MGSSASKVKVLQKTVEEMKDKIKEMEREACTKHDAFQKIESEKSKLLCKVTVLEELAAAAQLNAEEQERTAETLSKTVEAMKYELIKTLNVERISSPRRKVTWKVKDEMHRLPSPTHLEHNDGEDGSFQLQELPVIVKTTKVLKPVTDELIETINDDDDDEVPSTNEQAIKQLDNPVSIET